MNLQDLSFTGFYYFFAFAFVVSMGFLAIKGRKISSILLAIYIPQILGTILSYSLIQIFPFLLAQLLIFLIVIPLVCFMITFFVLIKLNFLKKFTWLNLSKD